MTAFWAEFVGTFIVVLIGLGVSGGILLRGTKSQGSGWLNVALGWGLAYMFGIFAVYEYSGAHLNPAVTIGLAAIRQFSWNSVTGYIVAQIMGALIAALIVYLLYLPHWNKTSETNRLLNVFVTSPSIKNSPVNLLNETIATFLFMLGLLIIRTSDIASTIDPLIIGLLVMAIGLSLGGTTGFAINPARDLGPRIIHYLLPLKGPSEWIYAWVPILGPIIGGIYGALFYQRFYLGVTNNHFWTFTVLIFIIIIWSLVREIFNHKRKAPKLRSGA